MVSGTYRTVTDPGETAFRVTGSRFVGRIAPASGVDAAEEAIAASGTKHPDATHVVPAYRVRADPFREYHRDAGEPSGSAGSPMMRVLRGEALENVVAVVVRYYGGTNLGIGGLCRAYAEGVKRSLADTDVVERKPHVSLRLETEYDDSGTVRSILERSDVSFDAAYEAHVTFQVRVPVPEAPALRDRVMDATGGRVDISRD